VLDRADRLHRQFFTHAASAWEPPVDVVEIGDELWVYIALPGVSSDSITIGIDPGGITVSALRGFPCRDSGAQIHRVEIPYGRFERRIQMPLDDPYSPLELSAKSFADGLLTLVFRRKEGP
jgi:HSP20 family molecular chaperone IbpA